MSDQTEKELEQGARDLLERLDAMDVRGLADTLTDDAQGVDEITRGWTRGRAALEAYLSTLEQTVSDVRSRLSDLQATAWGDFGLVTFVLDQTYRAEDREQTLTAPTSLLFRRERGRWKVALIHSVPIPDQAQS